jgi:hypothetical protein
MTATGSTSADAFDRMPLVYERAFGGHDGKSAEPDRDWDWRNSSGPVCRRARQPRRRAAAEHSNSNEPVAS